MNKFERPHGDPPKHTDKTENNTSMHSIAGGNYLLCIGV